MTDEDYKLIEEAINKVITTNKISSYFINNLSNILSMSYKYNMFMIHVLRKINIENCKNNLTEDELLNISKKIICIINKDYSNIFDNIIKDNIISFNYDEIDKIYNSSIHDIIDGKQVIKIYRKMNYYDVISIIHEFMHYTNYNKTILRDTLTEFISIYFEIYATKYLIDVEKYNINEFNSFDRFIDIYNNTVYVLSYIYPFMAYINDNKINEDSYLRLNIKYKLRIKENVFNKNCFRLYNFFSNKNLNYENIASEIQNIIKYIYCSFLAFYSIENLTKDDILDINLMINNNIPIEYILDKYNLQLNSTFINKSLMSMKEYATKYMTDKNKQLVFK